MRKVGARVIPLDAAAQRGNRVRENHTSSLRKLLSSISHSVREASNSIRQVAHEFTVSKRSHGRSKPATPTGNRIFRGGKLFWRERLHADIILFQHSALNYFEVVAIDTQQNKELNRVYIYAPALNALVEECVDVENLRRHEIRCRDTIKEARLQCSVDYIMESLHLDSFGLPDQQYWLRCEHYNGNITFECPEHCSNIGDVMCNAAVTGTKDDLTSSQPINLTPGKVDKVQYTSQM